MVFPYMDHDLAGLLENERVKLQPSHIKLYMKQLLEGTEYMHRVGSFHPDTRSRNFMPVLYLEPHSSPGYESCQFAHL